MNARTYTTRRHMYAQKHTSVLGNSVFKGGENSFCPQSILEWISKGVLAELVSFVDAKRGENQITN